MQKNNSRSRVSVIIPTYNQSKLLRMTVESVMAQTYPNIEIVVVDDGSTDDTATVIQQYAGRVIYIKQPHQGGGGRNTGFGASSGEYVNFLDHDDLIMPSKIERQVDVLNSKLEIGLVHCGYYHIDEEGNLLDKTRALPEGNVLKELVCGNFVWSGAPLIRRQCLDQVGRFDAETYSSDWDMWLRISQAEYRFACVQEPLGAYRIRRNSEMTNIQKVEQGTIYDLDKVFADPNLSADLLTEKAHAYGSMRLWLGCRYYAANQVEDGSRNLAEAFTLLTDLAADPLRVLRILRDDALSPQVTKPFQFVENVLDHLPPVAQDLGQYRTWLVSQVHLGWSLRQYAQGDLSAAQQHLIKAIEIAPSVLEDQHEFADVLHSYAMRQSHLSPGEFVQTVFQNLPSKARKLERNKKQLLGNVYMASAFENYAINHRAQVPSQVLNGVRYNLDWLKNRGVVSMFLKSLPAMLRPEPI